MFEDLEPQICNLANLRELSNAQLLAKIGVDTAENDPCKDLQKVCKILQDLQKKFVKLNFARFAKFLATFFGIFKNCLELFGIFKNRLEFFGIFKKWLEFFGIFKKFLKMSWNFWLPNNHSYRTTARSAPVDTANRPR